MPTITDMAGVAALAGDPARARMLDALLGGRALTAGELAHIAGVTPQTASGHLAQLTNAGLLAVESQGRHRYHRLAMPEVAVMIEHLMHVATLTAKPTKPVTPGPRDPAMRAARTCYDHLAGRLGVAIADAMVERGQVEFDREAGALTEDGTRFLGELGVDLDAVRRRSSRIFCRPCLDWSERRPHLAGAVGAAICAHAFDRGWIRRLSDTRAVSITRAGEAGLKHAFGIAMH